MNELTPSRILDFFEASRIVLDHAKLASESASRRIESVRLLESLGRVLAEPIPTDRDQPPFPRATRDGFACHAADIEAGRTLEVIGLLRAGESWPPESIATIKPAVGAGEAVEIMTGAPVPSGADCVAMVEHVQRNGTTIRILEGRKLEPGENIVSAGAEARAGEVLVARGVRMSAATIAAAAACGAAEVRVFARPHVSIVATGDELVELRARPLPSQIRNSNSYSLAAQILTAGAEPVQLGIARDNREHLKGLIEAARRADLVLLTGGVSMGKFDLVEEVLLSLGAEFFFTGVLIQPGKPVVFGRFPTEHGHKYLFGLPGNPVSTMVTFSLFVEPFLAALSGSPNGGPRFVQAKLGKQIRTKTGLTRFLPGILQTDRSRGPLNPTVSPVAWQGSGDLANTSRANCFVVVPADRDSLPVGETVTVLLA